MREKNQKTIKSQVNFSGIGLHSGIKTNLSLRPAKANHGVVFKRVDLDKNNEILANYANVSSAKLCTKIENNFGNGVSTIEHLMAAIYICGIDNLTIEIDGPEVPIMDGSAKDFYEVISKCGSITQNEKRKFIKIIKKINLNESGKSISIEPSENNFSVDFTLSYKNPLIKTQSNKINFQEKDLENIYSARTFCLFEDIEKIKEIGLAKGGSLENAIVVQEKEILNEEGLRNRHEFVGHKILDCLGDLMLSGHRIFGHVKTSQGGHQITNLLLRKLFSDKSNWEFESFKKEEKDLKETVFRRFITANA